MKAIIRNATSGYYPINTPLLLLTTLEANYMLSKAHTDEIIVLQKAEATGNDAVPAAKSPDSLAVEINSKIDLPKRKAVMVRKLLVMVMTVSLVMTGCVTPHVWKKKTDLTEKKENADTVVVLYSSSSKEYCVSFRNRVFSVPGDSHENSHNLLLSLQKEHATAERLAEYRLYKKLPIKKKWSESRPKNPIDASAFLDANKMGLNEQAESFKDNYIYPAEDVLTIGILMPLMAEEDELSRVDSAFVKSNYNGRDTSYYHPSDIGRYTSSDFSITEGERITTDSLLRHLLKKEGLDDKTVLNVQALAWLDRNGAPLVREKGVDAHTRADSLLIRVTSGTGISGDSSLDVGTPRTETTYYRYRSRVYLLLERFGAFSPDYDRNLTPDIYLLRVDRKNNRALIGFQAESKIELTAEGRRKGEDLTLCEKGDWQQLADADGAPYLFEFVESHEARTYRYPLSARALFTPAAIAIDVFLFVSAVVLALVSDGMCLAPMAGIAGFSDSVDSGVGSALGSR